MSTLLKDYTLQGFRSYRLKDFPIPNLISKMHLLCRKHRLEILIIDNIVYEKNTNKYDQPRNPYV